MIRNAHKVDHTGEAVVMDQPELLDALARGLMDIDNHKWAGPYPDDSLLPHYVRDAEQFLLPRLTALHGGTP